MKFFIIENGKGQTLFIYAESKKQVLEAINEDWEVTGDIKE